MSRQDRGSAGQHAAASFLSAPARAWRSLNLTLRPLVCAAYLAQAVSCLSVCSYPYNLDFDYGPLEGLQKYCINNLGAQRVPGAADADAAQLVFVPLAAAAAACSTVPACKWA